jgi:hypothetical protein
MWCTSPKLQHAKLLLIFLTFSVVLLSTDIITDFIAADEFFRRGDTYWGSFTLIPVFAPLGVRLIMLCYSFFRCIEIRSEKEKLNKIKLAQCIRELQQLHWHIPLFQPIRFARYILASPSLIGVIKPNLINVNVVVIVLVVKILVLVEPIP